MSSETQLFLADLVRQAITNPKETLPSIDHTISITQHDLACAAVHQGFCLHQQQTASELWSAIEKTQQLHEQEGSDLPLLAGDCLYAFALGTLAEHSDLAGISDLANTLAAATNLIAKNKPQEAEAIWRKL